jgi:hypothetical protein
MSAFGGEADMTFCGNPLSRSLSEVKRTRVSTPRMSAYDSKRTCEETMTVYLDEATFGQSRFA